MAAAGACCARAVALDPAAARKAVGRCELAPGFVIAVTFEDDRLFAQAPGQGRFELLPDSLGDYYATVTELQIRFTRDAEGHASALTLFQGGGARTARRIGE